MGTQVLLTDALENRTLRLGTPAQFDDGRFVGTTGRAIEIIGHSGRQTIQAGTVPVWIAVDLGNESLRALIPGCVLWAHLQGGRHIQGELCGVSQQFVRIVSDRIVYNVRRRLLVSLWQHARVVGPPEVPNPVRSQLRVTPPNARVLLQLAAPLDRQAIGGATHYLIGYPVKRLEFEGALILAVDQIGELQLPFSHVQHVFVPQRFARIHGSIVGRLGFVAEGPRGVAGTICRTARKIQLASVPPVTSKRSALWVEVFWQHISTPN